MRIPFDIKYRPQIESGEYKLETECGHPVSIMDWEWIDHNEKKCLAVKVLMDEGFNIGYLFDYDGKRHSIFPSDSDSDLFIVTPEPKLTEFEERLVKFYNDCKGLPRDKDGVCNRHDLDKLLHNTAAELLAMARKQLQPEMYAKFEKIYENADKIAYENGVLFGKAEMEEAIRAEYEKGHDAGKKEALEEFETQCKFSSDIEHGLAYGLGYKAGKADALIDELTKLPGFKEEEK